MLKPAAINTGTAPGVGSPTGLKPLMLGVRQPQGGAADPTQSASPGAPGADPQGVQMSGDPAGAALQEQDIRKGQEAIAELDATKQELKAQKSQGAGYQGAASFVGARLQNVSGRLASMNKSLARLGNLSTKGAATSPTSQAPAAAKAPSLDNWKANDSWDKSINTSALTHAFGGSQQPGNAPNTGWYNRPILGGPSLRNVAEGINEVGHNGLEAWDNYGLKGPAGGTELAKGIPEGGVWKAPAQAVDTLTALPSRIARGAPRLLADAGSFMMGPMGSPGDVARDVWDTGKQVLTGGKDLLWSDVNSRASQSLSNAGSGALSALSVAPAGWAQRLASLGLGGFLLGGDPAAPAQPAPNAPTAAPETAPAQESQGDYLAPIMALLKQMGDKVGPYISSLRGGQNAPQQRDLPSVVGAGGHEVRNPTNYM